jgi:HKD family nuclease
MIHPKKDRLDYGEQLIPPFGYNLNYAVGTTYSLDLEALMVIPVALFYSQTLDIETQGIRYDILDAITKSAEKIKVYCQKGKIMVPEVYHNLISFWEEGIEEVEMPNHVSSFHPKIWVIRFTNEDLPPIYRILITSRNLTFSRDWDIAFSSEGEVSDKTQNSNIPLIHFLNYLEKSGKQKLPKGFLNDLSTVKFDIPEKFSSMEFFPIGVQNQSNKSLYSNPLQNIKWKNLLIISPFVDNSTLKSLKDKTSNLVWLLSRKEELDSLPLESIDQGSCYQFSQFIRDAEKIEGISEEKTLPPQEQNLHAKVYIGEIENKYHWMLGSANCSQPAYEARNIEFMINLSGTSGELKPIKAFKGLTEIKEKEINLFEPYNDIDRND